LPGPESAVGSPRGAASCAGRAGATRYGRYFRQRTQSPAAGRAGSARARSVDGFLECGRADRV